MLEKFREFSDKNGLVPGNRNILTTVSGGIDSMVLVHLYLESGLKPAIAHCNFGLRGSESDGDEAFVREFALKNNLAFHTVRFETSGYAVSKGISIQMAARELRYNWFEEVRKENGYEVIAVAHNLNDNIETFFINLLRGTGINGLTGMKPHNGFIVRPLLFASREEITEYAGLHQIQYREDSSNAQVKYVRNRIRHKIIPLLKGVNPEAFTAITTTMEHLAFSADIINYAIENIHADLFSVRGNEIHADIQKIKSLVSEKAYIFELFRKYGLSPHQCDELTAILDAPVGKMIFTGSHRIIRDRNDLVITSLSEEKTTYAVFSSLQQMKEAGLFSDVRTEDSETTELNSSPLVALLDSDLVRFPLTYRHWQPGDKFSPLGMNGMKKISDFLVDNKLSIAAKERVMVLVSGSDIVWVSGYRIDNRFRVTEKTRQVLIISL
jgi:tRNA(Ile)-lysidine synthase